MSLDERPILFSAPMVRAILAGRKSQTRRALRDQQPIDLGASKYGEHLVHRPVHDHGQLVGHRMAVVRCPYGRPGDRLWVRETGWQPREASARDLREGADTWPKYAYDADGISDADHEQFKEWGWKRRPSIFMPRWASRITLEVIEVRAQRLQDITEDDAKAEGCESATAGVDHRGEPIKMYRTAYVRLWNSLNAARGLGWLADPWVWAVTFRKAN